MFKDGVSLQVLIDGKAVQEYDHKGSVYIEGIKDKPYVLRLSNNTSGRILVVPTVDGLSVMDGKLGNSAVSDGYILDPYRNADIPGWRLDDGKVAQFQFGAIPESYAEKTGKGGNTGVIGVAAAREQKAEKEEKCSGPIVIKEIHHHHSSPWLYGVPQFTYTNNVCDSGSLPKGILRSAETISCNASNSLGGNQMSNAANTMNYAADGINVMSLAEHQAARPELYAPAQAAPAPVVMNSLGTQFGTAVKHKIFHVPFTREAASFAMLVLHYDTREGLMARGILLGKQANPFPDDSKGCQPPEGWKA